MLSRLPFTGNSARIAVVRLSGLIAAGGSGGQLNDATVAPVIDRAFSRGRPTAVALVINSPGGSPVQSSLIGARLRRLADEKKVPVLAFVEDVAASGGYWIAAAADEIWVDAGSVVGSIGVISASFGVHDLIARHGIERRVHTAGASKSMLDPFQPEKPEDVARLKDLMADLHTSFIAHVRERRGGKLSSEHDLFSGDVWIGSGAVRAGLVDGIGHLVPKIKERFGEDARFRVYQPRRGLLQRLGAATAGAALSALEERAAFARLGL